MVLMGKKDFEDRGAHSTQWEQKQQKYEGGKIKGVCQKQSGSGGGWHYSQAGYLRGEVGPRSLGGNARLQRLGSSCVAGEACRFLNGERYSGDGGGGLGAGCGG